MLSIETFQSDISVSSRRFLGRTTTRMEIFVNEFFDWLQVETFNWIISMISSRLWTNQKTSRVVAYRLLDSYQEILHNPPIYGKINPKWRTNDNLASNLNFKMAHATMRISDDL